jgi:hypothetical protein
VSILSGSPFIRASTSRTGEFSVSGLQPGAHTVTVRAASEMPGAPRAAGRGGREGRGTAPVLDLWAIEPVTISGRDVEGLSITLQPGLTLTGRVTFEGASDVDPATVAISVAPPSGAGTTIVTGPTNADIGADGTFSLEALVPGRYAINGFVRGGSPLAPAWVMQSVTTASGTRPDNIVDVRPGGDLSGVVVTFTNRVAELSGRIVDAAGRPAPGLSLVVMPADRDLWRMNRRLTRTVPPSQNGTYRLGGLLPGEYLLAAVADLDQADLTDDAFYDALAPAAIRLTLGPGERKVQDVQIR